MARWRAIFDTSFEKSFLKINGGEVANITIQAIFEPYDLRIAWWRAIPDSSFENIFLKNHWWRGGERIKTATL